MKLPVLIGVTHNKEGEFVARVPRAIKIAIGKPKGRALHVYMSRFDDGSIGWVLEIGSGDQMKRRPYRLDQLDQLKKDYARLRDDRDTPKRTYPESLAYFTFFRDIGEDDLAHDFDVIEKHGVKPRQIDVVITDDEPFRAEYEFWAASGLRCRGNGVDAMRSVDFTPTDKDRAEAEAAKKQGERYFPIYRGCATCGCPYINPVIDSRKREIKQCGVHGRLAMQLLQDIRLGAKAEYETTGRKSVIQLSASLTELATFTGGGDPDRGTVRGIPLMLAINKFKTKHNNIPGTAYAVRLEFRADSMAALRDKISEAAMHFLASVPQAAPAARQLEAPAGPVVDTTGAVVEDANAEVHDPEYVDEDGAGEAQLRDAQFNTSGGGDDDGDDDEDPAASQQAEAAFAEAKAELMRAAEQNVATQAAPAAQPAAPSEPPVTDWDSADDWGKSLRSDPIPPAVGNTDPGEQGDVKQRRRNQLKF